MANSQTTPDVLAQPFAENGDKNAIPTTNDPSTGLASLSLGLPPITSQRIQDGGKAPRRADVNGIMNLVSQQHYFFQNGGFYPFRADVSSAIGGYPLNALLLNIDSNGRVSFMQSLVANNTYNYVTNPEYIDGVHWRQLDIGVSKLPLLIHTWTDHLLNDIQWLRADTFSWQSGAVYVAVYNHLVDDIDGVSASTEVIGSYTITYYQASDGHKIVLADQEATVANIYNESGVAWYYVLDTTNQRFKLPRTKYGFTGLRDTVGKYVEAGLPNITGYAGWTTGSNGNSKTNYGAFKVSFGGTAKASQSSGAGNISLDFDASLSNSIYGASTTVQPPATQMYLYFYVGNFSQSAVEQTAGITTTQLNAKVDLDAGNLNNTGKSLIAELGMPSDTYEVLTLGASGSTYTAPANGWVDLRATFNGSGYFFLGLWNNDEQGIGTTHINSSAGGNAAFLPVKKNDTFKITYSNLNTGTSELRFCYAVGSESEAS